MNLNYQQLPLANPVAGLTFGEPASQRVYKPLREQTLSSLQRDQPITSNVARVAEPVVISDLRALREEERNTQAPIAPRAFLIALNLLEFAHLVLGDLPHTLLVPSGEGGITIEWFRDDRIVRVIIPPPKPDQAAYIYERVGRESDIKAFSKSSVIQSLRSIVFA
ncbi:MAG: hypothetical protein M3R68_02375 [Acidobacteriota bacterium]|nr:hypothetical protein [Acidobacteriota bacterium]